MRVILAFLLSIVSLISPYSLAADPPVILVLGDSLSAGYGMNREQSWVHLLQLRLDEQGHSYRILNSSISGSGPDPGQHDPHD
jgi:acyl-CoA thioesterase-1